MHAHSGAWNDALVGWMVMVAAMMWPVLIDPVRHIRRRSFMRRRWRSVAVFVAGYLAAWTTAGLALTVVALPAAVVGIVACVWQCSPIKQLCLNRCHVRPELPAFGVAADLGVLRFGVSQGAWCVGSCWALMLWPMSLLQGQGLAMVAVMLLIVSERLESPMPLRWRVRGLGRVSRLVVAQARMRFARA